MSVGGAKADDVVDAEMDDHEATDPHASDASPEAERLRELLVKTDHEEAAEEVDVAAATEKTDALATESLAIPEPLTRVAINEMEPVPETGEPRKMN